MKYIAMFLPQFHECEFNSQWWGKGFTEWNNVKSATPLFTGHRQPRSPAQGYYDLSTVEELASQAKEASLHGISAFSIYHYWYEGKRPLSKPLDLILNNPNLSIEFSLCWANHSWTRSWRNRSGALDVLIEQTYENDITSREKHFSFLSKVFADKRYTRINNKPLFQIYMPENIPNCSKFISELRLFMLKEIGSEIYISAIVKGWSSDWTYLNSFDSVTLFQPSLSLFSVVDIFGKHQKIEKNAISSRLRSSPFWIRKIMYYLQDLLPNRHSIYSYHSTWKNLLLQYEAAIANSPLPVIPMAFIDFDNTPRYKKRAKLFQGYSTEIFEANLYQLSSIAISNSPNDIVFINAWNEWGEGMYLQADEDQDNSRLLAIKKCEISF